MNVLTENSLRRAMFRYKMKTTDSYQLIPSPVSHTTQTITELYRATTSLFVGNELSVGGGEWRWKGPKNEYYAYHDSLYGNTQ